MNERSAGKNTIGILGREPAAHQLDGYAKLGNQEDITEIKDKTRRESSLLLSNFLSTISRIGKNVLT